MSATDPLDQARQLVASAEALLITAGAGMGVDSGLPDFRGSEGFWQAYPHAKELGLEFAELANPKWFREDPELAWGFYGHRARLYSVTEPHEGFALIKAAAHGRPSFVFTSNVDGHFQKAGWADNRIYECHGSLHHLQCLDRCSEEIWQLADDQIPEVDLTTFRASEPYPICPQCGGLARPNVLMFGDGEWLPDRSDAQYRNLQQWLFEQQRARLVVIEIGAGTAIPSVRNFSEQVVWKVGGTLIRINPRESQVPPGVNGVELACGARHALQRIFET